MPKEAPSAPGRLAPAVPASSAEPLPVFATADGVEVRLVSAETIAVAFHEASRKRAMAMTPHGVCVVCRNRGKFRPPPGGSRELPYLVLDSRGRRFAATSAVDLVLPEGSVVRAPVSGVVTGYKRYRLYDRYPDARVAIRPDGHPDREVVMIHLAGVRLQRGQRVEASVTEIGSVRRFPFESHVERYAGRHPHVHLEVKDGTAASRA
ncbi:MAG TPA: hypothetical protein VEA19_04785 [Actinomycetota bacterium]|nr:hypothetical protein [Actinomycetota bacterium]